jgi:hypothetical protein
MIAPSRAFQQENHETGDFGEVFRDVRSKLAGLRSFNR